MPRKSKFFWLAALIAAWAVDILFFDHLPGISLSIWTVILLGGGLWLAYSEGVRPAPWSWILMGLMIAVSAIAAFRVEPLATGISLILTIAGAILLAATFRDGNWPYFRTWDTIVEMLGVLAASVVRPFGLLRSSPVEVEGDGATAMKRKSFWKRSAPIFRGLLLALPVVAVLMVLLSSADIVFADRLKALFSIIDIEKLPEYIFRGIYILVLTFLFTGVYLHAVLPSRVAVKPDASQPLMKPFLGWTEAVIVLGAVVLLFAFFVVLQFQYLFGGAANITAAGYTYSEYARRGFGELVGVAVISLLLMLTLGTIARREGKTQQRWFTVLNVALLALVLVILGSALQRLLLYEQAYGYTRLRAYTLIFIPWLALLLIAAAGLELARKGGRFGFALLVAVVGFGMTVGIWNVDGFIARQNIERGISGQEFDRFYLGTLSADSVPVMLEYYKKPGLDAKIQSNLGAELACMNENLNEADPVSWPSFNFSRAGAAKALAREDWSAFEVVTRDGVSYVTIDNQQETCYREYGID